ncbi:TetR/AcrR family transcriptional regulator, partial [Escherichia coli]|nr:TetR/AcrR family transcriptional regulator [Escherichia coli]
VIQRAKESGEIKQDTDVKKSASLFRQVFLGLSYEQSFLNGLDVEELKDKFDSLYSLLKA